MEPYVIMPFRFGRFDTDTRLLVNIAGEHYFIGNDYFAKFVNYQLRDDEAIYHDLKCKNIIAKDTLSSVIDQLAIKYRTKFAHLRNFTSLHMVVTTARCNHSCRYCQASAGGIDDRGLDMGRDTARRVVDYIFRSPSPVIKIEFQGGEPLLNFDILKYIVKTANSYNKNARKALQFVIATNLTTIDDDQLGFINKHGIYISTSLDGPKELHDKCRVMRNGLSSYDNFISKLKHVQNTLGSHFVSALMTTTQYNLNHLIDVVDEYVANGFTGIFLRALNPYGRALIDKYEIEYSTTDFIESYNKTLNYIIELNLKGTFFIEYYTALILRKILTPFSTGFVDLQSPTGAGIMGAIYDYNGDIYPTDEGRMLARMGDKAFFLGNVNKDKYLDVFGGHNLMDLVSKSCVEILPQCADCVYCYYCGSDPIRNYEESHDIVGHRPSSDHCAKNMGIIAYILELIRANNKDVMDVFWSWISNRSLAEVRKA